MSRISASLLLLLFVFCMPFCQLTHGQQILSIPSDPEARESIERASDWLAQHVYQGSLAVQNRECQISVVAWKDPTLNPEIESQLAGYAITDTLWSSYALTLTHPKLAQQLHDSLEKIGCLSNSLHEVIWQRIEAIHHKPADTDHVHGRSLGVMSVGEVTVDVRSFSMAEDANYTIGHPLLFAEHAVYQSLFEFRNGRKNEAEERIRQIFQPRSPASQSPIHWDAENCLLIDYVNEEEYNRFKAGASKTCRQYSFKLAALLYASRLMGLESEFPEHLANMQQQLRKAQLSSGGIAHFFDALPEQKIVHPCQDATGEATAIFILSSSVKPADSSQ